MRSTFASTLVVGIVEGRGNPFEFISRGHDFVEPTVDE